MPLDLLATALVLPDAAALGAAASRLAARLHPVIVHFPIALILVAAGIEVLRARRRDAIPSPVASTCLLLGAPAAAAAAGSGWLNALLEQGGGGSFDLESHRWVGIAGAGAALLACLCLFVWKSSFRPWVPGAYRAILVLAAGLIGLAGHLGGSLVYGSGYLTAPIRELFPQPTSDSPQPHAEPPPTTPAPTPAGQAPDPAVPTTRPVDFATEVWPILNESCIDCHGDVRKRGQLRLDSLAAMVKGGKSGPSVVPGNPDASTLVRRVRGLDGKDVMPLEADPLTPAQIDVLDRWIRQGAAWPQALGNTDTSTHEEHWAYRPVHRPAIPAVSDPSWVRNPIDAFVLARLDAEHLRPSQAADPGVLLRRLSLDLVGLPPTAADLDHPVASEQDYAARVEALLASPAYGERWARMWLDQARYADSRGYEKDQTWSMWPYRDWVIRAFNSNMPFDQFTREQLAGDLLPTPTTDQQTATGFSRCSMINEEGGVDPEEFRVNSVIDRANAVSSVWLGSTLACAQCHDHKYDPFTQRDFYRFYAYFNNTPIETQDLGSGETRVMSPELRVAHPLEERWKGEAGALSEALAAAPEAPDAPGHRKRLDELNALIASGATTQVMREQDSRRETHILARGSFLAPGEAVSPGTPAILPPPASGSTPDRLGLATWLVSPENPLTPRVTVNRIWAQYFGQGLVTTDDDFGTRGSPPSHPELLDFLASELVASGWDLKHLHRLIVTSSTYRQSSATSQELRERDPHNTLLARGPRFRLDAETIRDAALAISGLLSPQVGGPSVFPPQPPSIWGHAYSGETWKESAGSDRYRRGLYTFWKRSTPYPTFVAFDAPSRQVSCTRRPRTNTALQALTTLNDPAFLETAGALAQRIAARDGTAASRAGWALAACTARTPEPSEIETLVRLFETQTKEFARDPAAADQFLRSAGVPDTDRSPELAAWTLVANVLLNLDEVLTKG